MRWNQDKQSYEATDAKPLPHEHAIKATQLLTEHMVKDGVTHAFHGLGGMSTDKDKATMFKFTLSLEGLQRRDQRGIRSAQADRGKTTPRKEPSPLPNELLLLQEDDL